jgi:hypothetical protein
MKKQILEELNDIKYLFNYNRGKVISEQEQFEAKDIDFEEINLYDEDDDEDINYLKGEFNENEEEFVDYDNINYGDEEEFVDYGDINYGDEEKYYPELRIPRDMPSYKTKYRYSDDDMDNRTPEERERRDINMGVDEEIIEKREVEVPVRPGTKEREKTKTPSTPYKPKPGPKPDPKARKRKGDMPDWLTFDELGIDFE